MNYTQLYKQATMNKVASDEQIYKVAALMKHAAMNKEAAPVGAILKALGGAGKAVLDSTGKGLKNQGVKALQGIPAMGRSVAKVYNKNIANPAAKAYNKSLATAAKKDLYKLLRSQSMNYEPSLTYGVRNNIGDVGLGAAIKGGLKNSVTDFKNALNDFKVGQARRQIIKRLGFIDRNRLNSKHKQLFDRFSRDASNLNNLQFNNLYNVKDLARQRNMRNLGRAGTGIAAIGTGVPLAAEAFDED